MMTNIILIIVAYLLGSIPSAIWIGKRFYGIDVREHGSHNAGATNTLRVLGRRAAVPVFMIDFAKGFTAVMLWHLSSFPDDPTIMFNFKIVLVAAVVLGHIFPVFANFRGGKGVATLSGAVMGVYPPAVLLSLVIFLVVWATTQYVSLASVSAGVSFPFLVIFLFKEYSLPLVIFSCVIALLLLFTHRKNIKRLLKGTETKTYFFRPCKNHDQKKKD